MESIDVTPTWGEVGNLFYRLALSGEGYSLWWLRRDMAKAFAMAEALRAVLGSLDGAQALHAWDVVVREMKKQGF